VVPAIAAAAVALHVLPPRQAGGDVCPRLVWCCCAAPGGWRSRHLRARLGRACLYAGCRLISVLPPATVKEPLLEASHMHTARGAR
jgi:hypothetical protein